jgi:hypothetical protein
VCDFHDNTSNTIAKKICKDAKESTPTILQPSTSSPVHHTEIPQWPVSPLVSNEQPNTESVRRLLVLDDELDKLNDAGPFLKIFPWGGGHFLKRDLSVR